MVSRARPTLVNLIHISLAFVKNGKNQKISAKLFGIFFAALDEPERKRLPRACYILSPH